MIVTQNFSILYVDDEEQNLISFKAAFRRDYTIFTANSGKNGIELLRKHDIQLVISDQRMPEMTGVQFFEAILTEYPDTVRIIMTGFSDVQAIIDAINNGGIFRYISKPWDERELRLTIENARQLYQLKYQNRNLIMELKQKMEEQEKVLKLFVKYVPEPVVKKALSDSSDCIFEGELKHVTVLFCDIRGFTPMSELMQPKEVVAFLNDYYSIMTDVVQKHNGTVNQYVGDEIFAVFGAPIAHEKNEENAVYCAIEMMTKLANLNQIYQTKLGEIQMGIGINSGEVIAGNLGSQVKIDYSITGDTVNTGKRIETLTKELPNSILVSESVHEKTNSLIEYKTIEPLYVKGKKNKIAVFRLLRCQI